MVKFIDDLKNKMFDDDEELEETEQQDYGYEQPVNKDLKSENAKVVILEPRCYEEAQQVAIHLLRKKAVAVNIHKLDHTGATRLIDFLSGAIFAIGGSYQKLGDEVFIFSPKEMPLDGSIESDIE